MSFDPGSLNAVITVGTNATTSAIVTIPPGEVAAALQTPAALTSTACTFEVTTDGGTTWVPLRAVGGASAYSVTVAAGRFIPLDDAAMSVAKSIRLVMGSSEAADRTIKVITRPRHR